jgi:hypothetical protein
VIMMPGARNPGYGDGKTPAGAGLLSTMKCAS